MYIAVEIISRQSLDLNLLPITGTKLNYYFQQIQNEIIYRYTNCLTTSIFRTNRQEFFSTLFLGDLLVSVSVFNQTDTKDILDISTSYRYKPYKMLPETENMKIDPQHKNRKKFSHTFID
ncbi:hypothetical protein ACJX0J_012525 [Zea mays]